MSLVSVVAKPEVFTLEVIPLQSGEFGIFNCAGLGSIVGVTYSHTTPPASGETLQVAIQVNGTNIFTPITIDNTYNANTVYNLFSSGGHRLSGGSHITADLVYTAGGSPAPMDGVLIQVYVYFDRPNDYLGAV